MLSAAELSSIRASYVATLPDSSAVSHHIGDTVTSEGTTPVYAQPVILPCRYAVLSGNEALRVQQVAPEATIKLTYEALADIREADVITVTVAETSEAIQVDVVNIVERDSEFARIVYCKRFVGIPPLEIAPLAPVTERAFMAANDPGWRLLGTLPTGHWFKETDVFYNSTDGYYYALYTEMPGSVTPAGGPFTVSTWSIVGTLGTANFASPHNIPVGAYMTEVMGGMTARMNGAKVVFAVTANQVTYTVSATGGDVNGSGGSMTHTNQGGQVALRRATSLEGLATAQAGVDYFSSVASGIWYPTVLFVAPDKWYIIGPSSSTNIALKSFVGAFPNARNCFGSGSFGGVTVQLMPTASAGDPSMRLHPTDGNVYMVTTDGQAAPTTTQVYKNSLATILTNGWGDGVTVGVPLCANVWADIGLPAYYAAGVADPNLCFVDGKVYLLFGGSPTGGAGTFGTAVVELDPVTFKAKGLLAQIQTPSDYEAWQTIGGVPHVLGDPIFLRCPDGIDRILGWTNNIGDAAGLFAFQGVYGCLDLPVI